MPLSIIGIIVKGVQKVLTLSPSTLRTAKLKNTKFTTVKDALLDTEVIEVFRGNLAAKAGRPITTSEVMTFIQQNPGEAALVLYSTLSGVEDIYDTIVDLVEFVKQAIFDPSDPDGESTFASIEKQDGKVIMDTLGAPFGVASKVQLVSAAYQNKDDLTALPCTCGTHVFEILDVKVITDAVITVDKSAPAGCLIQPNLTTCERVKLTKTNEVASMDLCRAFEVLNSVTGDTSLAGQLAQAIVVIVKGENNG